MVGTALGWGSWQLVGSRTDKHHWLNLTSVKPSLSLGPWAKSLVVLDSSPQVLDSSPQVVKGLSLVPGSVTY